MQNVFAMAVELLLSLGYMWPEDDAVEIIHWLVVPGGELGTAAHVAERSEVLQISMIEEILATGAGSDLYSNR